MLEIIAEYLKETNPFTNLDIKLSPILDFPLLLTFCCPHRTKPDFIYRIIVRLKGTQLIIIYKKLFDDNVSLNLSDPDVLDMFWQEIKRHAKKHNLPGTQL